MTKNLHIDILTHSAYFTAGADTVLKYAGVDTRSRVKVAIGMFITAELTQYATEAVCNLCCAAVYKVSDALTKKEVK